MKKKILAIIALLVSAVALPLLLAGPRGNRYNFPQARKDLIKELDTRLRVIDANLVFDDKILTITLPGEKGEKGDTGQTGEPGKDGKHGLPGMSTIGPIGHMPKHRWEDIRLSFQLSDDIWGPAISLLGPMGRQGKTGLAGTNGINGIDGRDGKNGITPVLGVNYFNGTNGTNGTNGEDGINGYTPQKGIDYFDGKGGKDGKDGKDGEDAILPLSVTIQVLSDVRLADNGKLIKIYKQIKVYIE